MHAVAGNRIQVGVIATVRAHLHSAARGLIPRVNLSPMGYSLWLWGTRLGLPLLFVYIGLVVLMVRRIE